MLLSFRMIKEVLHVIKFDFSVDSRSLFLNVFVVFEDFILEGREFHITGPFQSRVCYVSVTFWFQR